MKGDRKYCHFRGTCSHGSRRFLAGVVWGAATTASLGGALAAAVWFLTVGPR